jgi:hypothetical protein
VINSSVLEMKLRKPISLILLAAVSMGVIVTLSPGKMNLPAAVQIEVAHHRPPGALLPKDHRR